MIEYERQWPVISSRFRVEYQQIILQHADCFEKLMKQTRIADVRDLYQAVQDVSPPIL